MGAVSKYDPLLQHLAKSDALMLTLSFGEVEQILGAPLPPSARRYSAWWANQEGKGHVESDAWMEVGYRTESLDLNAGTVVFRKVE